MTTLELKGRITPHGTLEVEIPPGVPAGEVTVRIDVPDETPWTEDEIRDMLTPKRKTMQEVLAWLDAHSPTEEWGGMSPDDDPAEFIHRLRHRGWEDEEYPQET